GMAFPMPRTNRRGPVVSGCRHPGRICYNSGPARGPGPGARPKGPGGPAMTRTRIAIYDTTLRDGSQGEGVNFSLQDKLLITGRLDDLGVDYIEGGYPL